MALHQAGLPWEVVPGITSPIAAPAYAGIPITQRGMASAFTVITGSEDPDKPNSAIDWHSLANIGGTLAFVMGWKSMPRIVQSLIDNGMSAQTEVTLVNQLKSLPKQIEDVLGLHAEIEELAEYFADKHNALFLGRGPQYPVAMEGALKLKEISYIHAEAYPAGELKHGPLALIDAEMPVISVAPNNELLEKLKSNLQEVSARGGEMIVFADEAVDIKTDGQLTVINVAPTEDAIAPIIFTIPLQLLSYYVAVLKGTDVDQPRNLAKSVTVE